jgi:hypothetical protein
MTISAIGRVARARSSLARSRMSSGAWLGNHASPNDSTRSSTPGPFPPTSTGGWGRWAGFGHDQIRSNETYSPL